MDRRLAVLLPCLLAAAEAVGAAEVYRWTDETGRVIYGDRVPEGRKGVSRTIDVGEAVTGGASGTPAARSRTPARRATAPSASTPAEAPAVIGRSQALPRLEDNDARCAAAWKRYNESYACFDAYRYGGVVRPEGYQQCEQVSMPSDC